MKQYRVDTFFGKEHLKHFFENRDDALIFAGKEAEKGKIVFLLEHVIDGKYDVVKQIQQQRAEKKKEG